MSSGKTQLCAGIGEQGSKVLRKSSVLGLMGDPFFVTINTGAVSFRMEWRALQPGIELRTVAVCLSQTP